LWLLALLLNPLGVEEFHALDGGEVEFEGEVVRLGDGGVGDVIVGGADSAGGYDKVVGGGETADG